MIYYKFENAYTPIGPGTLYFKISESKLEIGKGMIAIEIEPSECIMVKEDGDVVALPVNIDWVIHASGTRYYPRAHVTFCVQMSISYHDYALHHNKRASNQLEYLTAITGVIWNV